MGRPVAFVLRFAAACCLLLVLTEGSAFAVEREWHVGADGGLAFLGTQSGWGAGAHLTYGLSDAFNAMLELDVSHHGAGDDNTPSANVASLGLGAAYTLDITRWVPYLGFLAGGYRIPELSLWAPGFQIPLGLDYRFDRNVSVGVRGPLPHALHVRSVRFAFVHDDVLARRVRVGRLAPSRRLLSLRRPLDLLHRCACPS